MSILDPHLIENPHALYVLSARNPEEEAGIPFNDEAAEILRVLRARIDGGRAAGGG